MVYAGFTLDPRKSHAAALNTLSPSSAVADLRLCSAAVGSHSEKLVFHQDPFHNIHLGLTTPL